MGVPPKNAGKLISSAAFVGEIHFTNWKLLIKFRFNGIYNFQTPLGILKYFAIGFSLSFTTAYYKTRNAGTWNNRTRNTPEQWRNSETLQNINGTPTQLNTGGKSGTTEPYKTNNNCSDFKQNFNLTLIHLTLSTQILRLVYTKIKSFLTNKYQKLSKQTIKFERPLQHLASNIKEFKQTS